jgi:hypothetical protein
MVDMAREASLLKEATEIWMSMISLAASPGTAVEPMWSIRTANFPKPMRNVVAIILNSHGQLSWYGMISIIVHSLNSDKTPSFARFIIPMIIFTCFRTETESSSTYTRTP